METNWYGLPVGAASTSVDDVLTATAAIMRLFLLLSF
jgi:hypothetical protein